MPFYLIRDDLSSRHVDAIVCPTDNSLSAGGGLDRLLRRKTGPSVERELQNTPSCPTGGVVVTSAGDLPARYILHTAGPRWQGGTHNEEELLVNCCVNCLTEADRLGLESVAMPLISTGHFGFPKEKAYRILRREILRYLENSDLTVYLVVYDRESYLTALRDDPRIISFINEEDVRKSPGRSAQDLAPDLFPGPRQGGNARRESGPQIDSAGSVEPLAYKIALIPEMDDLLCIDEEESEECEKPAPECDREESISLGAAPAEGFARPARKTGSIPVGAPAPEKGIPRILREVTDGASPRRREAPDRSRKTESRAHKAPSTDRPRRLDFPDIPDELFVPDEGFSEALLRTIDERGMTDSECYHRANMDRKHFSKLRCDPGYRPSKKTALCLVIALKLTPQEANDLLSRAGYVLSPSDKTDRVIGWCLDNEIFDINKVNDILFAWDLGLLGA